MSGIGHNRGPQAEGAGWRTHCWRQARTALLPVLPVEVVRLRVRRAQALGLDYTTYAGVRAVTGRDLVAFLFSSNGLGVFRDGGAMSSDRAQRLARLDVRRDLGVGPGLDPRLLADRIGATSAIRLPAFGENWAAMRDRMKSWLRAEGLPGGAVLMIGETDHERECGAAGGLAGFVTGMRYFEGRSDAI